MSKYLFECGIFKTKIHVRNMWYVILFDKWKRYVGKKNLLNPLNFISFTKIIHSKEFNWFYFATRSPMGFYFSETVWREVVIFSLIFLMTCRISIAACKRIKLNHITSRISNPMQVVESILSKQDLSNSPTTFPNLGAGL